MPDLSTEYRWVCPSNFHFHRQVEGKTGTYEVTFGPTPDGDYTHGWSCTCPAFQFRGGECKHIQGVKDERCAWNEDALSGSGEPRPEDGKCPRCREPLEVVWIAV